MTDQKKQNELDVRKIPNFVKQNSVMRIFKLRYILYETSTNIRNFENKNIIVRTADYSQFVHKKKFSR